MPQRQEVVNRFRRDGFLRLDGLFSIEELERVRGAFSTLPQRALPGVGVIYEADQLVVRSIMGWHHSPGALEGFAKDPRILEWARRLLGGDIEFHQTKYNPKAPDTAGGEKWDPHRGDVFWHYKDGILDPHKLLSVFIALTDQTEENGAVYAWKGSHVVTLEELRSHLIGLDTSTGTEGDTASYLSIQIAPDMLAEYDRRFERLLFEGPAGTVWFLDAGLLHASSVNRSRETRELVANVFRTTDNRPTHPRPQAYLAESAKGGGTSVAPGGVF